VAFDFGKWTDLQMLAALEGCGRMEMDYRALLSTTGFDLQEVVVNASPLSLLVAKPVERKNKCRSFDQVCAWT
jgi:hypothetical protein